MRILFRWVLALCTLAVTAPAQHGDYHVSKLDSSCPEGCRDADYESSCGSPTSGVWCNMAINGDVALQCQNGNLFTLTPNGCGLYVNETIREYFLCSKFETRTVVRFMYVFDHVYQYPGKLYDKPHLLLVSCIQFMIVVYCALCSVRFFKASRVFTGAIAGELGAMIALAAFNVTLDTVAKGAPLWLAPVALGLIAGFWRRLMCILCGFASGFIIGVIMVFEVYTRTKKTEINSDIFYVICAMMAFFTVLANPFRNEAFYLFVVLLSSLSFTTAFIQLAGPSIGKDCTSITVAINSCPSWMAEGLFVAAAIFMMVCLRFAMARRAKAEMRSRQVNMNTPLTNDTMTSSMHDYGTVV